MPTVARGLLRKPIPWNVSPGGVDPMFLRLWDGLVFAAMPGQGWTHELVGKGIGAVTGTVDGIGWDGATEAGDGVNRRSGVSDGGIYFPRPPQLTSIVRDCTLAVLWEPTIQDHLQALISIPYRNTGWTAPFASLRLITWIYTTDPDRYEFSYAQNSTTLIREQDGPAMALSTDQGAGRPVLIVVTRTGATIGWYRNGRLYGTSTLGTNADVDWGTGSNVVLGTRSDASNGESMSGVENAAWIWNRALDAQEIEQLARDPFGMFRRSRRIQPFQAASALPVLMARRRMAMGW